MRFEEGDVLEVELLLQVLGAGGDDDALAAFAGEAQGGQQVGEGLAGAGAGFDDEVALVVERGLDGFGHLVLAFADFEGEGGFREDAVGREEVVQRGQLAARRSFRGLRRDGWGERHYFDDSWREDFAKVRLAEAYVDVPSISTSPRTECESLRRSIASNPEETL